MVPMALPEIITSALLALIVFIVIIAFRRRGISNVPLPPGPPQLPVIGNLHNKPKYSEWQRYAEWGREYNSELIHLNLAGTSLVVLNSRRTAVDLLEKRGAIFSSRPHSTMVHELLGFTWLFAVMPNNEGWRVRRRLLQRYFKFPVEDSHSIANVDLKWQRPHETKYVNSLLGKFVDTPDRFMDHIVHMVGSVSLSTTFGLPIKLVDDPYIKLSSTGAEGLKQASLPGAFFVDALPIIKYLPSWVGFQRQASMWRDDMKSMLEVPFAAAKKQWQERGKSGTSGSGLSSFTSEALDDIYSHDEPDLHQEELIKEICSTIFMGTVGTTAGMVNAFMLAMVHHPDVQKRAQAELDSVLRGSDGKLRLPTHDDEPLLPYCTAIVKETFRWLPIAPIAIPHYSTAEDVYEGYRIPKGSVVVPNIWAMLRDPEKYPNPHLFMPERFILKDGTLDHALAKDIELGFGFGRRICPGRHLGNSIVWIAATNILATCDILKAKDANGTTIEPGMKLESAITAGPEPFKCAIKPRSEETAELIKQGCIESEYIGL